MSSASVETWWLGPIVLVVLRLLYAEAVLSRAEAAGSAVVFRSTLGLRLLFATVIVALMIVIATRIGRDESWAVAGLALIVLSTSLAWPPTFVVDDQALQQRSWWRPRKAIRWSDVCGVEKRAGGEVLVYGRCGEAFTFSRYHVDSHRFQQEVVRRANLDHVIDGSAPPSLRGV